MKIHGCGPGLLSSAKLAAKYRNMMGAPPQAPPPWWVHLGSNQGPSGYEPDALTAALWTRDGRPPGRSASISPVYPVPAPAAAMLLRTVPLGRLAVGRQLVGDEAGPLQGEPPRQVRGFARVLHADGAAAGEPALELPHRSAAAGPGQRRRHAEGLRQTGEDGGRRRRRSAAGPRLHRLL